MREIKFRAYDKKQTGAFTEFIRQMGNIYEFFQELLNAKAEYGCDWELLQFTGLKDKNGKEIYEGDIILDSPPYQVVRCTVQFITGSFMAMYNKKARFITPGVEVIGNLYENPELIK